MAKEIKYIYSTSELTKEELQSFVPNAEFSENIARQSCEFMYQIFPLPKFTRRAKRIKP
jgi:hypothetical protein